VKIADIDVKQSMMNASAETNAEESLSRLGEQLCGGSETAVRQLLVFGRYLHQLSLRLVTEQSSHTDLHRRMLRVSCLDFYAVHITVLPSVLYKLSGEILAWHGYLSGARCR